MGNIIEVKQLKKSYRDVEAVKGISFAVKKGSIFAFLGENGAGKSTTINIIATLLRKTEGELIINGNRVDIDDDSIRKDIGVVFQGNMLDKHLTVRENIINRGRMYHLSKEEIKSRLSVLSEGIGISTFLDRRYKTLSGGQKRRADIARALINKPKILILDEPTTGLDPKTRRSVWDMIIKLKVETDLTVFLTTHYMEEAAKADHVVIIDSGLIKAEGTPEKLRRLFSSDRLILIPEKKEHLIEVLEHMGRKYYYQNETIIINLKNSIEAIDIIIAIRDDLSEFEVVRGNMDDVFINVLAD